MDITKLNFTDDTRLKFRKDIRDTIGKFVNAQNSYKLFFFLFLFSFFIFRDQNNNNNNIKSKRIIWDRPMKVQPVHKDISRLSEKIKITHNKDGTVS